MVILNLNLKCPKRQTTGILFLQQKNRSKKTQKRFWDPIKPVIENKKQKSTRSKNVSQTIIIYLYAVLNRGLIYESRISIKTTLIMGVWIHLSYRQTRSDPIQIKLHLGKRAYCMSKKS